MELLEIETDKLIHDNYRATDTAHVQRIAESMRSQGYDSDYALRVTATRDGLWRIVDGHHRAAAALMAGLDVVPCRIVEDASGSSLRLRQLRANMGNRQDDDLTLAETFRALVDDGQTVEEIAAAIVRTPRYVADRVAMMDLDPYVRGIVASRGMDYVRCLSHLPNDAQREAVRALSEHPEWNLATWRVMSERIGQDYLARVQADSSMFDMGSLVSEVIATVEAETFKTDDESAFLGVAEVARRIGKTKQAVYGMNKRGQLPQPDLTLEIGALWKISTIDAWWIERSA
jgi:ParB-like chromosome segregation protein Spo0J